MGYHHGDLRETMLGAAAQAIDEAGVAALSLRELARHVGVTHTAPRHHFGDKRGLITALAAQGYRLLTGRLRAPDAGDFLDVGVGYVRFALEHPGHYQVMFHPELVDPEDPELVEAQASLRQALIGAVREWSNLESGWPEAAVTSAHPPLTPPMLPPLALAAWSIAHGFATLALAGNVPVPDEADRIAALCAVARATLAHLSPT